jgi:translation initiation factor IF-2
MKPPTSLSSQKIEVPIPPPTPVRREEPRTGRNLSAAPRLKVVQQTVPQFAGPKIVGTAPLPPPRPERPKAKPAADQEPAGDAASKVSAPAADKKGVKNWEAPRVTKRDLIGMTEEFEISRPMGRKSRKPSAAKIEKKSTKLTTPGQSKRKIKIESEIRVADLADRMGIKAADVVRKLISMGQMISAHQMIDYDTAVLIASEYEYEVENVAQTAESMLDQYLLTRDAGEQKTRAPVVTVMGHVDHGKTSLLDAIRKTQVVEGEAGGITQHIGAYQVQRGDQPITFLDTPGHQAFSKMRARGAAVTDLVILVVAADEGMKAQTEEAIAHAKSAKVPIIVAVNKMDKPEAAPDRVMQELSGKELVPEEWGGDTMFVKVSAKKGQGIDDLLDRILLQSEVLELKASYTGPAKGTVIESRLDRGKGPVASVLITQGTLNVGDTIVAGSAIGRVRALFNDRGQMIKEAGPSMPVEILGLADVPEAGEPLVEVSDESVAKEIAGLAAAKKADEARRAGRVSLEDMYKKMQSGDIHELRVILKGDVHGSIEAIADALEKIKHEEVRVNIIYRGAGGITESDVSLAAASGAIILGFNVRPAGQAKTMAAQEGIQIKAYSIIYELIDDVKLAMQGLLAPEFKENVVGNVEVREVFNLSKFGIVAGCFVKSGKVTRGAYARLIRDSVVVYDTKIASLRRFKEDAKEVAEGFECGLKLENFTDIKAGDIVEVYEKVEVTKAVI